MKALTPIVFLFVLSMLYGGAIMATGPTLDEIRQMGDALDVHKQAEEFLKEGRYEDALEKFNQAQELGFINFTQRGDCLRKTWWLNKAMANYDQVIADHPEDAQVRLSRGLIHEYKGYPDKALADYDVAIKQAPGLPMPYVRRGGIFWQRGEFGKASADLNAGIQRCNEILHQNPNDLQAYRARALAYRTLEQYDRAIQDYGQMIRIDSGLIEAYVERGRTYAKQQDQAASVADFNQAIKLATEAIMERPDDRQAYRSRTEAFDAKAFAWKDPQDFRRAVADLDALVYLAPGCPTVYFRRGHLYAGLAATDGDEKAVPKHFDAAVSDLAEVLRLDPAYASAWQERGLLYTRSALRNHRPELALRGVADLTEAIRLAPRDGRTLCARGSAHALAGDFARALDDFNEAIRLYPKLADAYQLRGGAYMALGKNQEAQADLAQAQELQNRTR